jgi:hypothetical protein
LGCKTGYGLASVIDLRVKESLFGWGESTEDIFNLVTTAEVVAYTDTKTAVVRATKEGFDAAETVVSTGATLFFETDGAEGKSNVVYHNKKLVDGYFFGLHPIADGFTAEIHESGGFDENQGPSLMLDFGAIGTPLESPASLMAVGKGIDHHETGIVAGSLIFGSDVAQSPDKIFHVVVCVAVWFTALKQSF